MASLPGKQRSAVIAAELSILLLLAACSPPAREPTSVAVTTPPPTPAPTTLVAPDKATAEARMRECRASLEAAIPTGLVRNASVDNGRPKLWVGPAWHQSTPAAKEALARDAACFFLSGDESKTIKFSVYDDSGQEVAVWNVSQLVTW
ncbi:MAG: hypothetical protein ABI538_02490 [Pseudoxanthomonas sp.]